MNLEVCRFGTRVGLLNLICSFDLRAKSDKDMQDTMT